MRNRFKYKGITVNSFGIPVGESDIKKNGGKIKKHKSSYHPTFQSLLENSLQKDLLVMFDIPNSLKKERDWFRRQLVHFGFEMIQKSVWIGPSPLPKEFTLYLKEIKLTDKYKIFKLAKSSIASQKN